MSDDGQTSLAWDASLSTLVSQSLPAKGSEVRVGLRISRLELVLIRGASVLDAFQFEGKTDAEGGIWLDTKLSALGLLPASHAALAYDLPGRPAADMRHRLSRLGRELGELSRWYAGAADILEEFRGRRARGQDRPGPVRCWPHHFDIAALFRIDERLDNSARSVGIGVSPGDEFYAQPYVYISPWPRPDARPLPGLPAPGRWHTEGFFAAIATADDILAAPERAAALRGFLDAAFESSRMLLER